MCLRHKWGDIMISIIITSYKRSQLLNLGLESIYKHGITHPYEIIVLNDGIEDETENITKRYAQKLNIKYIFTGQRNLQGKDMLRMPGFALNIGVKQATGDIIILSCAEMYHLDNVIDTLADVVEHDHMALVSPTGRDDRSGDFLKSVISLGVDQIQQLKELAHELPPLNNRLPFLMAMHKDAFLAVGGYDEDFIGFAAEDRDIIQRLERYGCHFVDTDSLAVHLYHPRLHYHDPDVKMKWLYNMSLLDERIDQIERNTEKNWGQIESVIPLIDTLRNSNKIPYGNWRLAKIPRIAHFYWGGAKLSFLRYLTLCSFRKYNPDWRMVFHCPKFPYIDENASLHCDSSTCLELDYRERLLDLGVEIKQHDMTAYRLSNNIPENIKSDIIRWIVLATTGGVWSDMDILYVNSIENLSINKDINKGIDIGLCRYRDQKTNARKNMVGFLMSSGLSPFFAHIYTLVVRGLDPQKHQNTGAVILDKHFPDNNYIQQQFKELNSIQIPINSVCYLDQHDRLEDMMYDDNIDVLSSISEDIIGFRWHEDFKKSHEFEAFVTDKNYNQMNNTISNIIRYIYND